MWILMINLGITDNLAMLNSFIVCFLGHMMQFYDFPPQNSYVRLLLLQQNTCDKRWGKVLVSYHLRPFRPWSSVLLVLGCVKSEHRGGNAYQSKVVLLMSSRKQKRDTGRAQNPSSLPDYPWERWINNSNLYNSFQRRLLKAPQPPNSITVCLVSSP